MRHIGKKYSEAKQIARLGNAVCPPVATALIRANCADMAYKKPLRTVAELEQAIQEFIREGIINGLRERIKKGASE